MNSRCLAVLLLGCWLTSVFDSVWAATSQTTIPIVLPSVHYYLKSTEQFGGIGHQDDFDGPHNSVFAWPAPAEKPLRFALFIPQIEDTWKSFSYAAQQAAKQLNVQLSIYSAKGYVNLGRQLKQIRRHGPHYDGLIISAIDSYKLNTTLNQVSTQIPIVAYANEVYSKGVHAKAVAFFTNLGAQLGYFLIEHIQNNLQHPVKIAFVMGPKGAAWSDDMKKGVVDVLNNTPEIQGLFEIVEQRHGHTKKKMQEKLVRLVLERHQDLDILVGTAPAIERAASIQTEYQKRHPNLQLAATYLNAELYSELVEGKVMAAGWDDIPVTGQLAVSMLLKLVRGERPGLKKSGMPYRVAPVMKILTPQNISTYPFESLFGPKDYVPQLSH